MGREVICKPIVPSACSDLQLIVWDSYHPITAGELGNTP